MTEGEQVLKMEIHRIYRELEDLLTDISAHIYYNTDVDTQELANKIYDIRFGGDSE